MLCSAYLVFSSNAVLSPSSSLNAEFDRESCFHYCIFIETRINIQCDIYRNMNRIRQFCFICSHCHIHINRLACFIFRSFVPLLDNQSCSAQRLGFHQSPFFCLRLPKFPLFAIFRIRACRCYPRPHVAHSIRINCSTWRLSSPFPIRMTRARRMYMYL